MKKLFAILAVTTMISSCGNTDAKTDAETDSTNAAVTTDSLAAIQPSLDTTAKPLMDSTMMSADSTKK